MALGCFDRRPLEIHFCRAEQFSLDGELLDFFFFLRPCHRSEVGVGPSFPQSHSGLFVFLIGSFFLFFFCLTTAIRLLPILFCVSAGTNGTLFASIYRPSLTQQVGLPRHLAKKKGKKSNPDSFFLHSHHDGTLLWKIYCKRNDLVMNREVFFFWFDALFSCLFISLCLGRASLQFDAVPKLPRTDARHLFRPSLNKMRRPTWRSISRSVAASSSCHVDDLDECQRRRLIAR